MKTVEKLSLILILVVGLCLALVGYFLFLDEEDKKPVQVSAMEEPEDQPGKEELTIISDIEGDTGISEDEALPEEADKDIGSLAGRVLDPDDKPLAEALVGVFRSKSPGAFILKRKIKPLYTMKTDESGRFRFEPLYPGSGYRVIVDHDLFMRKTVADISVKQLDETKIPDIRLLKGKTAYGRVRTKNASPIEGAVVAVYDPMNSPLKDGYTAERVVKTNEKGEYSIDYLDDANFFVKAWAEGYATQSIRNEDLFTMKEKLEFNFFLTKAMTIKGGVIDENQQPVAEAVVHAISMKQKERQNFTATTDKKGNYLLKGLPEKQFHISVTHPLFSTAAATKIDAGRDDVYFQLERRSGLAGQVVDWSSKPVRSFWVKAKRLDHSTDAWCTNEVKRRFQHKDGRFIMDGLDPGSYTIEVVATDFAPFISESIKVKRNTPTTDLIFQLNQGGSVNGTVFSPEGRPLKRALISLRRNNYRPNPVENFFGVVPETRLKTTRTDSSGYFILERILPGTYQVEYAHGSYPAQRINDVVIRPDQTTELDVLTMKQGSTLQGKVYNDANTPLAGVKVTVRSQDNTFQQSTTTDAEGFYRIPDIPPGTYSVSPMPKMDPNVNPLTHLPSVIKSEVRDVEIREGEVKVLSLIIRS